VIIPDVITPGQTVDYEILVRNPGSTPVAAVRVEQGLPTGMRVMRTEPRAEAQAGRVTWNLGSVEPGGELRLKLAVQPGEGGELPEPVVSFAPAAIHQARIDRSPLAVSVTAPGTVRPGDKLKLQIRVANNGAAPVQNVLVRDQLPDGLHLSQGTFVEADVGTLQPGEAKTLPLEVTAVRAGRWVNEVTALADGGQKAQARVNVTVAEAALAVRLLGPRQAAPGDIELTLEVANPGPTPATGVRLTQSVPDGLDAVAASTGGALDPVNSVVVWSLGTLGPGQKHLIGLRVRARAPGDWALAAQAVGDRLGEAKADLNLRVEATPLLRLELAAHEDTLAADAETTYEIHAANQGGAAAANVRLTVSLPEGLTLARAEGPTATRTSPLGVTFDPLPQLRPRADAVYRVRLRGRTPGDWRIHIELGTDGARGPLLEEVGVRVTNGPVPGGLATGFR
jgi:uncharacterized repeat protein (TIGR01451 family)